MGRAAASPRTAMITAARWEGVIEFTTGELLCARGFRRVTLEAGCLGTLLLIRHIL